MQTYGLQSNIYRLASYAYRHDAREKYLSKYSPKINAWEKLKLSGVNDNLAKEFSGISRATYYRYKKKVKNIRKGIFPATQRPVHLRESKISKSDKELVLKIRRENPTYGKSKITTILKRDYGMGYSESTIGRIIKEYMDKGVITKSLSAPRQKRKRRFSKHAQAWNYKTKPQVPGDKVQIDHMTATKNKVYVKHFKAWDPISKVIIAEVYGNAKSATAKKFLHKVIEEAPFNINSIQVDGGSEFMKEFEEECAALKIPLYVLPPKKPKYNGGVERGNRIFREEFYADRRIDASSICAIRYDLKEAVKKYNTYRPHFSLKNMTPYEYIEKSLVAA